MIEIANDSQTLSHELTDTFRSKNPLLEVQNVSVSFGGVKALNYLSFSIGQGELCALIGPNGAGKTTFFNIVSGVYKPTQGSIRFEGKDLFAYPPHAIAKVGITRTFQNLALFPGLTVCENVMVGGHSQASGGFLLAALRFPVYKSEKLLRSFAMKLLGEFELSPYADLPCSGLPYGTLKRIEFARALASRPKLLLLDEPASGLTHSEVFVLGELIQRIRDSYSLSLLLVEHHMAMVMSISEKIVVMEFGHKIAEGTPHEIQENPKVIQAYLGGEAS